MIAGGAPALRVSRAVTRLTVHRLLPIAKRASRGGCTTVRRAMKKLFLKMSAAMKVLVNSRIVLKLILKFIEMVLKDENDFEISEFYRSQAFPKS
jgi:hypothetical protein